MNKMRIQFADFWGGFDPRDNFWTMLLDRLSVPYEVVDDDSDLLVASCFGVSHPGRRSRRRMYWTGENWYRMDDRLGHLGGSATLEMFDMVYSFDLGDHPNHYRLPLYLVDTIESGIRDYNAVARRLSRDELRAKFGSKGFCTFVQANGGSQFRNSYFKALNGISLVDSYGPLFNNTGLVLGRAEKVKKAAEYKFQMSFENSQYAGYITEKIVDAIKSDVIPIYWGGSIKDEFNTDAIIDVNELGVEASLDLVRRMKDDFDLYWHHYDQPIIRPGQAPLGRRIEDFLAHFENFINSV